MDTFFTKSMNTEGRTVVFDDETELQSSDDIAFKSQTNAFTGTNSFSASPTGPTPATSDNSTSLCTTAYVKNQGYATVLSPTFTGTPAAPTPATSDNSTNISTTAYVKNQGYATVLSPTFTGTPAAPTPATSDNSTKIATTAYVKNQGYATVLSPTFNGDVTIENGVLTITNNQGGSNMGYLQGALRLTQGGLYAHEACYFRDQVAINGLFLCENIDGIQVKSNIAGNSLIIDTSSNNLGELSYFTPPNCSVGAGNIPLYVSDGAQSQGYNVVFGLTNLAGAFYTGRNNCAIGINTLPVFYSGSYNCAIGSYAGSTLVNGSYNTFLGGNTKTNGNYNTSTAVGWDATITDSNQISIGRANAIDYVKISSTKASTSSSTGALVVGGGIGCATVNGAKISIAGTNNVSLGNGFPTAGDMAYNTIIGTNNLNAGASIYSHKNVIVGTENLTTLTGSCHYNVIVGYGCLALYTQVSITRNSVFGMDACSGKITGARTSAFGNSAGSNNKYGDNNTFLGAYTAVSATDTSYSDSTAVGYGATITASNQVVLGRSTESVYIPGYLQPAYIHPAPASSDWVYLLGANSTITVTLPTGMSYDVYKPYSVRILFRLTASNDDPSSTSPVYDITGQMINGGYDNGYCLTWVSATQLKVRTGDLYIALTYNHSTSSYTAYSQGHYRILIYP